jgi:hypothetical protein
MNASVRPTSTTAILSLAFGLAAWLAVPVLGSFGAILCGHMARAEIRRSNGQLEGDGYALAGLILGYLQLAVLILAVLFIVALFGGLAAFFVWAGLAAA